MAELRFVAVPMEGFPTHGGNDLDPVKDEGFRYSLGAYTPHIALLEVSAEVSRTEYTAIRRAELRVIEGVDVRLATPGYPLILREGRAKLTLSQATLPGPSQTKERV